MPKKVLSKMEILQQVMDLLVANDLTVPQVLDILGSGMFCVAVQYHLSVNELIDVLQELEKVRRLNVN